MRFCSNIVAGSRQKHPRKFWDELPGGFLRAPIYVVRDERRKAQVLAGVV